MNSGSEDLRAFCEQHYESLVGALSLYCGDIRLAEEFAQEALAVTCANWNRVKAMENREGWTFKVAVNIAKSFFRRRRIENRAMQRLAGDETRYRSEGYEAENTTVRQAIARLPHRQKQALVLRYYLDLPFREVAQWMEVPESTAKSLVRRAVQRLRSDHRLVGRESINVT